MSINDDHLTAAELLQTAEKLFSFGEANMYRASVLEAITALEASVKAIAFPALESRVGKELATWLEDKTRMDFDTRLSILIPVATGLKVNKQDRLWSDYKKAKETRNKVTHAGTKVTRNQARFVIDTVYEWIEYLKQAQESKEQRSEPTRTPVELLGRLIQASARLERVIYSAIKKNNPREELLRQRVYPIEELYRLNLVDQQIFQELRVLRDLRNKAVHTPNNEDLAISEQQVKRLNQIVDEIEAKI